MHDFLQKPRRPTRMGEQAQRAQHGGRDIRPAEADGGPSEEQLRSRAWSVADRYVGQMQRLRQSQTQWHEKKRKMTRCQIAATVPAMPRSDGATRATQSPSRRGSASNRVHSFLHLLPKAVHPQPLLANKESAANVSGASSGRYAVDFQSTGSDDRFSSSRRFDSSMTADSSGADGELQRSAASIAEVCPQKRDQRCGSQVRDQEARQDNGRFTRIYGFSIGELLELRREYDALDVRKRGTVRQSDFLESIRLRLQLNDVSEIPPNVVLHFTSAPDLSFEDYLAWTQATAFCSTMFQRDGTDDRIQQQALLHRVPSESVAMVFRAYKQEDPKEDGLDKAGFLRLLLRVIRSSEASSFPAARLDDFWRAADTQHKGCISFDEFEAFLVKYFEIGSARVHDPVGPGSVYAKLGSNRFSAFLRDEPCHSQHHSCFSPRHQASEALPELPGSVR